MFSIGDIACIFGMNQNTVRYWLKKNQRDYECNFYNFNINNLIYKIKSKRNQIREYSKYVILDIDEFKYEFFKYVDYIKSIRQKKRAGKYSWTLSAIDCYNCQMECSRCFNNRICQSTISEEQPEPPMKNIVRKLLKEIGKPPNPNFLN